MFTNVIISPLDEQVQQLLWFTEWPVGGEEGPHKIGICNNNKKKNTAT